MCGKNCAFNSLTGRANPAAAEEDSGIPVQANSKSSDRKAAWITKAMAEMGDATLTSCFEIASMANFANSLPKKLVSSFASSSSSFLVVVEFLLLASFLSILQIVLLPNLLTLLPPLLPWLVGGR